MVDKNLDITSDCHLKKTSGFTTSPSKNGGITLLTFYALHILQSNTSKTVEKKESN